jgi:hypothetical protein
MDTVLVARCVECKSEREIFPGEIPPDEMPVCSKCFMPMIAAGAKVRVRA